MIENRRFFRLPSHSTFVLGNTTQVFSGRSTNISLGGAFIHILDVRGVQTGRPMKCDFMLQENGPVLSTKVQIRRVALGSTNPADYSGLGVEFQEFSGDAQKHIEGFILEQKRIYQLLGTLLMNTEPDMRSMKPLISRLPLNKETGLRDLRVFVESALRSIQMMEAKENSSPQP
jgi:hypothetical protein